MNITSPTISFPVESVVTKIDCTQAVRDSMPNVKTSMIILLSLAIILDIGNLMILTKAKVDMVEELPCLASIFMKGCLLSIVWTFP